jgi:hypothetical protein
MAMDILTLILDRVAGNHNQTIVHTQQGRITANHNQTLTVPASR